MSVILAVILLSGVVVFYRALLLGGRRTKRPWWAGDSWISYVFGPCLLAMFAFGVGLLVRAAANWSNEEFATVHAGTVIAIVAAAVAAWWLLNVWSRVAARKSMLELPGVDFTSTQAVNDDVRARGGASTAPSNPPPKAA